MSRGQGRSIRFAIGVTASRVVIPKVRGAEGQSGNPAPRVAALEAKP
jgi:hypothetical protein